MLPGLGWTHLSEQSALGEYADPNNCISDHATPQTPKQVIQGTSFRLPTVGSWPICRGFILISGENPLSVNNHAA